ncbi:ParA family protein [Staphylococcus aureus]|uniref:ParA family protein n=1 Tax=Staphylococcus aureus TaxID=1280 RepID=UPI00044C232A|nr:ParA family protein [Staphylococcus aureus]EZW28306.1 hypothetical protein V119_02621 [Staphylococcus aureus 37(18S2S5-05)]UZZ95082.1 ParA family protein [Staphylococcus aureus]WAA08486.1 ParA family protein [Staphylococcus aureus]HDE3239186.1 ParA family protein [Staphylococcus aureus]HDF7549943.1 ParA family protein [Staphylococcus aureus]
MAYKCAMATNKGGVLKTSCTVNIATSVAMYLKENNRSDEKVAIIDTDGQGNCALSFGYIPDDFKDTIYDVLMGNAPVKDIVYKVDEELELYLLPSNDDMNYFTIDVINKYGSSQKILTLLKDRLNEIENEFSYIFVDTPPTLDIVQMNVLNYVDRLLIPYQPEVYSMRSIQMFLDRVKRMKESNTNLDIEGVLVTLYKGKTNAHKTNVLSLYKFLQARKIKVFDEKIPQTIKVGESIYKYQKPAVMVNEYKNNPAIEAYKSVAESIVAKNS